MRLEGYAKQFAAHHPEAGEIAASDYLTGVQANILGQVFESKITALMSQPSLSGDEAALIDRVVDLGSRNIIYAVEWWDFRPLVSGSQTENLKWRARDLIEKSGWQWPSEASEDKLAGLMAALGALTGSVVGIRRDPELRTEVEDYAVLVMPYFASLVAIHNGLHLDRYLADNLQNLIGHYEKAEGR
jgi:hypothetical protein